MKGEKDVTSIPLIKSATVITKAYFIQVIPNCFSTTKTMQAEIQKLEAHLGFLRAESVQILAAEDPKIFLDEFSDSAVRTFLDTLAEL